MCRRCAASARDMPWRSRSAASSWPSGTGGGRSGAANASILSLPPGLELAQLRRVGESAAKLLQIALLRGLVAVGARHAHAQNQGLEVGGRHAHVASEIVLRVLGGPSLEGDLGQVVERADHVGTDQDRAAQRVLGL